MAEYEYKFYNSQKSYNEALAESYNSIADEFLKLI